MKCPNNVDCEIRFTTETGDNGDPSTPYFSSWTIFVYDPENSHHVEECPPLTNEQINQMEDQATYEDLVTYNYGVD